jgi:23S rRNA (uracil1939-C5)-methyltransferase
MQQAVLTPPQPDTTAVCPYFGVCGGCSNQDVSYQKQLQAKQEWIENLFSNLYPENKLPILGSPQAYPTFFRNKIRFSFIESEGIIWPSRHSLGNASPDIPVEKCFLHSEEANQIIRVTAAHATIHKWSLYSPKTGTGWFKHLLIRQGKATGEIMVAAVTDQSSIPGKNDWIASLRALGVSSIYHTTSFGKELEDLTDTLLWGQETIHEKVGNFTFTISPQAFFQTNSEMITTLYNTVGQAAGKGEVVWDLYAGSATIGCFLSHNFTKVISIESNPSNIADASDNIASNHITNLAIHEGLVEDIVSSSFIQDNGLPDVVVVDPPRAGLHQRMRTILANLNTRRIVYVSCNPLTAYRDIRELKESGYRLASIQPVDMFPHSWHVELVAVLEK